MKSLAVVGTGIAGMASAYLLKDTFRVTMYEKNRYIGGHTNTVTVKEAGRDIPIDTGFMVYNQVTYPNLVRLFRRLGVTSRETSMSFSVNDTADQFEIRFSDLKGVFPTARSLLSPDRYSLLWGMKRFFDRAQAFLESDALPVVTLDEFVKIADISPVVVDRFLLPMTSAIWSTPCDRMLSYPAQTLFRFLKNHGMLGFTEQYRWRTVEGGSQQYKNKLLSALGEPPQAGLGARRIRRVAGKVEILDTDGNRAQYDKVIVATHADQALELLDTPTQPEREVLSKFRYNVNPVVLHSDKSVMPKARNAWSSWNYRYDKRGDRRLGSTHYWMNSLQSVSDTHDYFVSVDYQSPIDESKVYWRSVYEHPRFDEAAIRAQPQLERLNQDGPIYFCGSYFRYGFHEDALTSATDVCRQLLDGKDPLS